jgi:hypothetical protein
MESVQFGGRPVMGFGIGAVKDQSVFVRQAPAADSLFARPSSKKIGAFVGGAILSGVAGATATALFGGGGNVLTGALPRLRQNWRVLAATAVAGGIAGVVAA